MGAEGFSSIKFSADKKDSFIIAGKDIGSRLLIGTSNYPSREIMRLAIKESGSEIVTVALRRINKERKEGVLDILGKEYFFLANTAGCYTCADAVLTAHLSRELLGSDWIKLEVIGDRETLFPDIEQLLEASMRLVEDGFVVLPYCSDDPVLCRRLEDIGCAAIMPLAAPIGSGMGVRNPYNLRIICENSKVPVIVDAGIGTASDATLAMELGCDGVLVNSAIARAKDPVNMARSMRYAVLSGRYAFLSGRIPKTLYARGSTSDEGII